LYEKDLSTIQDS
jgi:ribonuclease P protein component